MIYSFSGKYAFLSNFWPCQIAYDGLMFPSTEHAFQAQKCTALCDKLAVRDARTPGIAKKFARLLNRRPDWDLVKVEIMFALLQQKFSSEPLYGMLRETGNQPLIEGNTWGDKFWGVYNGVGQNKLGELLMTVRENANVPKP